MRRFVVFNSKGGVGKTTIACALAATFGRHGYRAVAFDADPQGSLSAWFDVSDRRGLSETLVGKLDPRFAAIQVGEGFHLVPTGDPATLDLITRRRSGEIPPYVLDVPADVFVVDTAAGVNGLTEAFMRWLDPEIIVPITISGGFLPYVAIERVWNYVLDQTGRAPDYLVPNMADGRTAVSDETLGELREFYADYLTPAIRVNAQLTRAPARHVVPHDRKSCDDFGRLAEVLYARWGTGNGNGNGSEPF